MKKEFVSGAIYALGQLAELHHSDVEIADVLTSFDFLPQPVTRDALVAAGAEFYDAERVMACVECREPVEE